MYAYCELPEILILTEVLWALLCVRSSWLRYQIGW